jgi:hypothetical protein
VGCPSVLFNGVTADGWDCVKQKVRTYAERRNIALPALDDRGEVSHLGFSLSWVYDPDAQMLTITCTSRPFLISCAQINAQVQHGIAGTGCIPSLDA